MGARPRGRRARRCARAISAAIALLLVPAAGLVSPASPAVPTAAEAGSPKSDTLLTAEPLPTWQTNGVVYVVEAVGDVVYVGGNFTAVRPPDAPQGTSEVRRKNMAAFDAATGELLPFEHTFSSPDLRAPATGRYDKTCSPGRTRGTYTCDTVYEIRASRDGTELFVGGDFQKVDGRPRVGIASFDLTDGALTSFSVRGVAGRVRALVPSSDRLYFGGGFTQVGGKTRRHLAAVTLDGDVTSWRASTDGDVLALELSPDGTRVIVGGDFDRVNGVRHRGLMGVRASTGGNVRWVSDPFPGRAGGDRSYATDLAVDEDSLYVGSNGEYTFDGRIAMDPDNGRIRWIDRCAGATWAVERAGPLLYSGSHSHDCSKTAGGFPETVNPIDDPADIHWHRFLAQSARDGRTVIQHWFPTTNGGIVGSLGPRDLTYAESAGMLWAGGEFTTVNQEPQQGLVRFGLATAPETVSAAPERPATPAAVSIGPGSVHVSWEATFDPDHENLTYTLFRGTNDVETTTAIHTVTASSDHDVARPMMSFVDTGLPPGSTASYQVRATDPSGAASGKSFLVPVTVRSADDDYRQRVLLDGARLYWPLDDHFERFAGGLVDPWGAGRYTSEGVTLRQPGALATAPDSTSVRTDGRRGMVRGRLRLPGPQEFSAEVWFKGTDPGKIFGFGSSNTSTSEKVDRHVYLDTDGRLVLGVKAGRMQVVRSQQRYDDGRWHHVVATLGPQGLVLFVDGTKVGQKSSVRSAGSYAGYWHLGGDSLDGWPRAPRRTRFTGQLDEFAVYPTQLGADVVAMHHTLGAG